MKIGFARQAAIAGPELFLSPPSGPGGQQVTLQGFGYQPLLNVYIQLGDSTIAMARTDDTGTFTTVFYMPITSEGAQNVSAVDESGNRATTSYFTEFGFGNIADQLQGAPGPAGRAQEPAGGIVRAMTLSTSLRRAGAGALALVLAVSAVAAAQDPSPQPGPAADTIRFNSYFVDRAPLEVQAGTMDLYLYGLRTEAAQQLRDAEGVQLFQAPATVAVAGA